MNRAPAQRFPLPPSPPPLMPPFLRLLAALAFPSLALADEVPGPDSAAFTASGQVSGILLPGLEEPLRFAVVGDFGLSGVPLASVSSMMRRWDPDFIVSTGDNNYGPLDSDADSNPALPGAQNSWESNVGAFFGDYLLGREDRKFPLQQAPTQRFFPTVGNHDSAPDPSNGGTIDDYLDYFHFNPTGQARLPTDRNAVHSSEVSYYAVRQGPVDLFVLDGDVPLRPDLIAAQRAWLSASVAASTARWKLAVFHQPPLTSGYRAAASWMLWDELKLVDAILCGHDHFYERLDYFGTPLFISGAGGQYLYAFRDPPHPRSLFRSNSLYSALLVTADQSFLRLESRGVSLSTQEETLLETTTLGSPEPVVNHHTYRFFAESGETIALRSATPPPLSSPPLAPSLDLIPPSGLPLIPDHLSSPDGRNSELSHLSSQTGSWQVKISASAPGRGAFLLQLAILSPLPDYARWSASLPPSQADPTADPDRDGCSNLLEYALQSNPAQPGFPADGAWQGLRLHRPSPDGPLTLSFDLPSPLPPGLSYQIEAAPDLQGPWQALAWRAPFADWQGADALPILTSSPRPGTRRCSLALPPTSTRHFFRLAVSRNG